MDWQSQFSSDKIKLLMNLFKIKRNQLRMVIDRGYNVGTDPYILFNARKYNLRDIDKIMDAITVDNFVEWYRKKAEPIGLRQPLTHMYANSNGDHLYAFYVDPVSNNQSVSETDLIPFSKEYSRHFQTGGGDDRTFEAILITPLQISSGALDKASSYSMNTDVWLESDLISDPTQHIYQSNIRKLSEIEAIDFSRRTGLTFDRLPILYDNDPMAKWYGLRPRDVILSAWIVPLENVMVNLDMCYYFVRPHIEPPQ